MVLGKNFKSVLSVLALSLSFQTAYGDQPISRKVLEGASGPAGVKNGIAFNKSVTNGNYIYGVSTNDSKIFILHANNGQVVDVFGPDANIIGPDDLVVRSDTNGNVVIYYTDTLGRFVGKLDVATRVTTRIAPNLPLINSIAMSDDEQHLYAGSCFIPVELGLPNLLFDINLVTNTVTPYLADFGDGCSLNGSDFKNGAVYGAQAVTGDIFRVSNLSSPVPTVENVVAGTENKSGCTNGPFFITPSAVQFDSDGRLFIIDNFDNKLYRVDHPELNCQVPVQVGQLPLDSGVDNMAFDPNDRLFVSSLADGYIARINEKNGKSKNFLADDGLVLPVGLTAIGSDTVLVGDNSSLRIVDAHTKKIDGTIYASIPGSLDHTGITSPYAVSQWDDNQVLLSNFLGSAIQIYDWINDTSIEFINTSPVAGNFFGSPVNAVRFPTSASDATPSIIALQVSTATFTSRIVQYKQGDSFATPLAPLATIPGILTGMATDGTNIYIAEYLSGTIFRVNINALNAPVPIAFGFSKPQGLALDNSGHLYIVETGINKRLVSVDTNNLSNPPVVIEDNIQVGAANALFAPLLLSSVSVDPDTQDIYYTATAARELRVIRVNDVQQSLLATRNAKVPAKKS